MAHVLRSEIIDYATYEENRREFQKKVFPAKARRRIHLGEYFTFLFENALTIRYQIQEMMRAERMVREKDILHEIETYNAILGDGGELGCTFMIEIDNPQERDRKLREWTRLPEHIYAELADGRKIYPSFDLNQRDADRLSSVQYLKFSVGAEVPVAVGIDLPGWKASVRLTDEQRAALKEDLIQTTAAGAQ